MEVLLLSPSGKDYLWGGTKLRDEYGTLDLLCDDLNVDRGELEQKLAAVDYRYDASLNRFV